MPNFGRTINISSLDSLLRNFTIFNTPHGLVGKKTPIEFSGHEFDSREPHKNHWLFFAENGENKCVKSKGLRAGRRIVREYLKGVATSQKG